MSIAVVARGGDAIIASGAKLEKLAGGFEFTEGPSVDAHGNVYFTDQPNDRIMNWSIDGKLSTFLQPGGRSNGLCFDDKGNLWACADERTNCGESMSRPASMTVVVKDYRGKLLNGPNDVWMRPDGGLYFTDPYYKRPYWKRGGPRTRSRGHLLSLARSKDADPRDRRSSSSPTASSARPTARLSTSRTSAPARHSPTTSSRTARLPTSGCSASSAPTA